MIECFDDEWRKLLSLISISSNGVTAHLETILRALSCSLLLYFIQVVYSFSLFLPLVLTVFSFLLPILYVIYVSVCIYSELRYFTGVKSYCKSILSLRHLCWH